MKTKYVLLFLLFYVVHSFSQDRVIGQIFDFSTKEPIPGVAIYYENKTIGTTTDLNGEFSLKYSKKITSPLVFSIVGYTKFKMNSNEFTSKKKLIIYLKESLEALDEVVIDPTGMKWQTKFEEFKTHYLGSTLNGRSCRILNSKDLLLTYRPKEKMIVARSKVPILIENKKLKYLITVNDLHFEAKYRFISKNYRLFDIESTYYNGSAFYKDLADSADIKTQEIRLQTYYGSVLHFMRSLAKGELKEEKFSVHVINRDVIRREDVSKRLVISPLQNESVSVYIPRPHLAIFYKKDPDIFKDRSGVIIPGTAIGLFKKYSSMESLVDRLYIDFFGNYSFKDKVIFSGLFGKMKVGDTLPLDFLMEE